MDSSLAALCNAAAPVSRRDPEWGWLEHLLRVTVQTSRLRLRGAWSVANKRLAMECAQRCRGLLQLHAWVPVSELPPGESVQEICQHGFKIGHRGVSFHIGNVRLPGSHGFGMDAKNGLDLRSRGRGLPQSRRLYEFLLCRVGVGRSYLVDSAETVAAMELPPEYDSFFIRHETGGPDADEENFGVFPRHVLHHEYIVRDSTQAFPLYYVHFEFDPEDEELLSLPLCDNCGQQAAKLYCEADDACFCLPCDTRVHAINTIARNHTRVEINRRPGRSLGRCPDHPEAEADVYCVECKLPLCPHCRSLGSHSVGEAAKHRCLPLSEAYDMALRGPAASLVPGMPDRQVIEHRLVAQLDGKLAAVQDAGRNAEDEIYDEVQRAVRDGQALADERCAAWLADELNAKRQLEQIEWAESFLDEKIKAQPPSEFLRYWLQHANLREELASGFVPSESRLTAAESSLALRCSGGIKLRAGGTGKLLGGAGGLAGTAAQSARPAGRQAKTPRLFLEEQ